MSFNYTIQEQRAVQIVTFKGRITSDADLEQLRPELDGKSPQLVFDLSELEYINSSGINFIIRNLTRCRVGGGELVLIGLTGSVKQLFELAKIDGLFTVYNNIEDSINHFNTNQ